MNWVWIAVLVVSMCLNLWSEKQGVFLNGFFFKSAASLSFLFLGLSLWDGHDPYGFWVLMALALCVVGDMLLVFKKTFVPGLSAFLLGHVAFCVAFSTLPAPFQWPLLMVLLGWGILVLTWLFDDLGRMKVPVCLYVGVICTMLWIALSVGLAGVSLLIPGGATLFALSDLSVARNRFKAPGFINRAWGLPTYYTAQVLLALSVGMLY